MTQNTKDEIKEKLALWNNIESKKVKFALIIVGIGIVGLKVFTTVLTFDWLVDLVS